MRRKPQDIPPTEMEIQVLNLIKDGKSINGNREHQRAVWRLKRKGYAIKTHWSENWQLTPKADQWMQSGTFYHQGDTARCQHCKGWISYHGQSWYHEADESTDGASFIPGTMRICNHAAPDPDTVSHDSVRMREMSMNNIGKALMEAKHSYEEKNRIPR